MLDCSCKNNDYTVAAKKQQNVQPDRVPDRDMGAVHCCESRNKEVISTRCSSGGYSEVLLIFGGPTDIRRLYTLIPYLTDATDGVGVKHFCQV